jgi:hypothetical protein
LEKFTFGTAEHQVGAAVDLGFLERVLVEGGDRDRHVLEGLLLLLRRDDQFLDHVAARRRLRHRGRSDTGDRRGANAHGQPNPEECGFPTSVSPRARRLL